MKTRVRLAARKALPEPEKMEEAGWTLEKTATPDPNDKSEKALAEDGKRASDEPVDAKVVADQTEPVTSANKESERTIRREEIIESDGPKQEVEEEENEETEEENSSNPYALTSSSDKVLLAFKLAELEQELGLDSQWENEDKYARVASLEDLSEEALDERVNTLKNVKEAGLSKPKARKQASSLPRLTASRVEVKEAKTEEGNNGYASDFAIFG